MKMPKRYLLGLLLIISIMLFSGLGFSQEKLNANSVLRYFASLYVPYEASREAGFSMTFGNEFNHGAVKSLVNEAAELPQRTFLK